LRSKAVTIEKENGMPRKKAGFKCPHCGQSFGMKMHLGRHLSAKHGQAPAAFAKPAMPASKPVYSAGGRRGRRPGRPGDIGARLGLRDLSLEQLVEAIAAAKEEAGQRIAQFQEIMR
jgi:uncharacterized C2H2 Zn-finger protein